jgi:hypothetical protein
MCHVSGTCRDSGEMVHEVGEVVGCSENAQAALCRSMQSATELCMHTCSEVCVGWYASSVRVFQLQAPSD